MTEPYKAQFTHASILLAGIALVISLTALSITFNAPAPPAEETVADFVLGVRDAILRRESGELGPPRAPAWSFSDIVRIASPAMGVIAILLAIVGAARRESPRFVTYGIVLGTAAILLQLFFWMLLVICGMILLVEVVRNLDSIMDLG